MTDYQQNDDIELSPLLEELAAEYAENPRSKKFLPLAEEYRKSRMYDEAIYFLNEGLKIYPDFTPAKNTLARCLVETEEWEDAFSLLTDINQETPNNIPTLRLMAQTYHGLGDIQASAETWKTIIRLNPEDRNAQEKLAEIDAEHGHHIDISSLDTPLFVPRSELKAEQIDEDITAEDEDNIELDLETEAPVSFDSLTMPEETVEEVTEISLSMDDSIQIDAQQGSAALRDAVAEKEEEEDIAPLELGIFDDSAEKEQGEETEVENEDDGIEALSLDDLEDSLDQAEEHEEPAQEATVAGGEGKLEQDDVHEEDAGQEMSVIEDSDDEEDNSGVLELSIDDVVTGKEDAGEALTFDEEEAAAHSQQDSGADEDNAPDEDSSTFSELDELDDPFAINTDDLSSVEAALAFDSADILDQASEEYESAGFETDDDQPAVHAPEDTQEETQAEEQPAVIIRELDDLDESERESLAGGILDLPVDTITAQGKPPAEMIAEDEVADEPEDSEFESITEVTLDEPDDSDRSMLLEDYQPEEDEDLQTFDDQPQHTEEDEIIPVTESSARVLIEQGDLNKARDIYKRLVTANPDNPEYKQALTQIDESMKQEDELIAEDPEVVIEVLESWLANIREYRQNLDSEGEGR